jgi:hypothetical protein
MELRLGLEPRSPGYRPGTMAAMRPQQEVQGVGVEPTSPRSKRGVFTVRQNPEWWRVLVSIQCFPGQSRA